MKSFLFMVLINLDRLLNVLTGGTFQECLSTRTYRNSVTKDSKFWKGLHKTIDRLFFWDNEHCKESFEWEVNLKLEYYYDNKALL